MINDEHPSRLLHVPPGGGEVGEEEKCTKKTPPRSRPPPTIHLNAIKRSHVEEGAGEGEGGGKKGPGNV